MRAKELLSPLNLLKKEEIITLISHQIDITAAR